MPMSVSSGFECIYLVVVFVNWTYDNQYTDVKWHNKELFSKSVLLLCV